MVKLARQIGVFLLAFGVFANGAAGAWALAGPAFHPRPAPVMTMSMTAMDMRIPCASKHEPRPPAGKMPCKCAGNSCAGCIAGMASMALVPASSPAAFLLRGASQNPPGDVNGNGIAVRPALPPPIVIV